VAQASRWYEEHALLTEAIETALSAQEFERAALLIERLNEQTYFTEHHTMCRWLEQIPKSLLRSRPALCFLFAQARIFSEDRPGSVWRIEPAEDLLQMAEEGWRAPGRSVSGGVLMPFVATFTIVHGFIAPAVAYARQALQLLHQRQNTLARHTSACANDQQSGFEWHCGCLFALSMEAMQSGAFDTAHHFLLEAYHLSLNIEDRVFTRVTERMLGDVCLELANCIKPASYYSRRSPSPPGPGERRGSLSRTMRIRADPPLLRMERA